MKKITAVAIALALTACQSQPLPKNPPLVPNHTTWTAVNANDFVPPNAKVYIKIKEMEQDTSNKDSDTKQENQ